MTEHNQTNTLPDEVIVRLRAAVGQDHVLISPTDLDRYSHCTIPWRRSCGAVVFPGSADEVAQIVRVAVQHGVPVWPFSTGRNWGYGATLATENGAIVMVLERMNRILEVNEELAYAVIEPGVTYEQLNAHLKTHGHKLWVDCIDGTPKGSVIGNALDRGIGETPYGDHFGNLCGLEVVLPDGEKVHVGGDSGKLKTWHTHKWGVGPYLEGLFSQSNLGVVTQAGIWLMPQPEAYNSFVFEIHEERNLTEVLDAFRKLALEGVITAKLHMINDIVSLTLLTQRRAENVPLSKTLSGGDLASLRRKYRIAPWSCGGGLYGTREQVGVQRALLKKAVGRYGKLLFINDQSLAVIKRLIVWSKKSALVKSLSENLLGTSLQVMEFAPYVHNILQGIPTEYFVKHAYFRHASPRPEQDVNPARDQCGLIWFAPILPNTGREILPYLESCKQMFDAAGFDFYVAMLLMNPRSMVCLMAIIYDKENDEEKARAEQLSSDLLTDMLSKHYQQYRAGWGAWDRIFETAPGLLDFNNRIKAALDPANILAPGRYGIGHTAEKL